MGIQENTVDGRVLKALYPQTHLKFILNKKVDSLDQMERRLITKCWKFVSL